VRLRGIFVLKKENVIGIIRKRIEETPLSFPPSLNTAQATAQQWINRFLFFFFESALIKMAFLTTFAVAVYNFVLFCFQVNRGANGIHFSIEMDSFPHKWSIHALPSDDKWEHTERPTL